MTHNYVGGTSRKDTHCVMSQKVDTVRVEQKTNILDELEYEKIHLEKVVLRKHEIKSIMKPLSKQYEAVKKEIEERKDLRNS